MPLAAVQSRALRRQRPDSAPSPPPPPGLSYPRPAGAESPPEHLDRAMPVLPQGEGELFTDPSADCARAAFRAKPRALADKLTSVADAVARLVHDGDYLAIGGFGA